jgi:glycosyltransferase involved in cell wall biosynthesis
MADPLRVGVDMSILRHPPSGSARWATGLLEALARDAGLDLHPWAGLRRLRRGGPIRKLANLMRDEYWFRMALPRLARALPADVVLLPVNLSMPRGPIPQVVTILDVNFLSRPATYDSLYARYATWAFRRSVRDADRVTTLSAFSRAEISRHLSVDSDRIRVVYPGLSAAPPASSVGPPPLTGPYALYVGATEPHKNVALLISAWGESSPGDLALAVVGHPGRDHRRLQRLAARMGGRVRIVGSVDPQTLERWYRGASVFLFPSMTEGFGYPPLEAMQRGIPVVAARAGALPEVLKDAALFHEIDDPGAVRALIERVVGSPSLRAELVAKGERLAKTYSWDATAAAMGNVLREAAG